MTEAYPLAWPLQRQRTRNRSRAPFNTKSRTGGNAWVTSKQLTVAQAIERLQVEVDRLGATTYVLSSNMQLRLDGLPRSGQAEPSDTGVALYFTLRGKPHCLPCDRYDRVADNIAAIAKHIEATRAIERYGVANLEEMFTGFLALPAPSSAQQRPWWEVLGIGRNALGGEIELAWREKRKVLHPDVPDTGNADAFKEAQAAYEQAKREQAA